ncbi:MAG: hypothetical protein GY870_18955 [archaeon]|nr:hypothetical protein [archaeon]
MSWAELKEDLAKEITILLYEAGMIRTWYRDKAEGWTLISGIWSPVYVNLRNLGSHPKILKKVGIALSRLIKKECNSVNRVVGIATAGVPISSAIAIEGRYPAGYTRKIQGVKKVEDFLKKIKEYGQHQMIEGEFENGDEVILTDDLVTKLDSKLIAVEQFRTEMDRRDLKVNCDKIIVLLDRQQGAEELAKKNGLSLYSLIPFKTKAIDWLKDTLSNIEYDILKDYLNNSEKYQDRKIQKELEKQALK